MLHSTEVCRPGAKLRIYVRSVLLLTMVLFSSVLSNRMEADDWPQWRGPEFKSISPESGLVREFNREKNMLWRTPMPGPAGSSPVVAGNNVFVTSVDGDKLVLLCIDVDGKVRWVRELDGQNRNSRDSANSASPSPCTDGQHVWAMMGNGALACYDMDGELIWKKDLQAIYGDFVIQFGMSATPVLDKGRLYLALIHGSMRDSSPSRGLVIALDAKTGEEIWQAERLTDGTAENKHGYASPCIYRDAAREFLVTHAADYVIGHSLEDGSELWRCGGFNLKGDSYNPYFRLVASPTCAEGLIVAPTAKRGPVLGLAVSELSGDVTGKAAAMKWRLPQGTPDVASPLIYQGMIYLAGEKGDLTVLDQTTGQQIFRKRLFSDLHRSTPVGADGHVYITDRRGNVLVLKADREFEVVAKNELGEEITASPAIANGRIFVRTFDALYAFGNAEQVNAAASPAVSSSPRKTNETPANSGTTEKLKFAIAIHGGAGSKAADFDNPAVQRRRASMEAALRRGVEILESGGSSLDAVEQVILLLEDDPQFNAGRGAVFNAAGSHELDASIMDGRTKACGAVAGVSHVKNPISLARLVMTKTRHVLLAGSGAEEFAREQGVELVEPSYFDTESARRSWERFKQREAQKGVLLQQGTSQAIVSQQLTPFEAAWNVGTVGCVALDNSGNLAAGTSTGGMTFKRFGRVGDSPIVGAGTYADNETCAVSSTGTGEEYIRNAIAYDIAAQLKYKQVSVQAAVDDNLQNRLKPGDGGLIAVDRLGNIAMGFNTGGMARAAADSAGRFEIIWGSDQQKSEQP